MEWGYKAAKSMLDRAGTVLLAKRGLLCRAAHEDKTGGWADHARDVAVGDRIHVYYVGDNGKTPEVASYEVLSKEQHETPDAFGDVVPETCLYTVPEAFIRKTDTAGVYKPDVVLGTFTGWIVRRVGPAKPYNRKLFPGPRVMVRMPEETNTSATP